MDAKHHKEKPGPEDKLHEQVGWEVTWGDMHGADLGKGGQEMEVSTCALWCRWTDLPEKTFILH
jgi:hypothetical protein